MINNENIFLEKSGTLNFLIGLEWDWHKRIVHQVTDGSGRFFC